ncbi:MAG: flagellar biosynthesis protein FlhA [Planctomycetota bacterium]
MENYKSKVTDLLLPFGIIASLSIIFVPLPAGIIDILLAGNIALAVIILLSTIYAKSPLELSVFPAILLITTLARLALNIATTRLILTRGPIDGEMAAGGVIHSFSQFVTGDSLAVGVVIFAIIFVIQFIVITKGATRISEVSARFALDGMPGRQMAIDADLNSGAITPEQAKRRRAEAVSHADFYGTMDGASKFVRGDAVAAILITMINMVAGFAIGIAQSMSPQVAVETFTQLTIGDGLASQVPALLISLAAGILVTRSTRQSNLPHESVTQIFSNPVTLMITAGFLILMVFTELPKLPLTFIAAGCFAGAYLLQRKNNLVKSELAQARANQAIQSTSAKELTFDQLFRNDIFELELGLGLIPLTDVNRGGMLLKQVSSVRQQLAEEMGLLLPKVRIGDELSLGQNEFRILIHGNEVERANVQPQCCAAIDNGFAKGPLGDGVVRGILDENLTQHTAFWITADAIESAMDLGYEVRSAVEMIADHIKSTAVEHADKVLTRDATKKLVDAVESSTPAVVDGLVPEKISIGELQQILKSLLKEGVSIRPIGLILETIGDHIDRMSSRLQLVEKVRVRLGRHITTGLSFGPRHPIPVFRLAPDIEYQLANSWEEKDGEIHLDMPSDLVEKIALAIQETTLEMESAGLRPIALVDQSVRPVIAKLAIGHASNMFVLGSRESENGMTETVAEITADQLNLPASAA